jgi:hypothetical protein
MREFNDRDGRWRVWMITSDVAAQLPAEVAISPEGWLCFESLASERRYRLPARNVPAGWYEGSDIILRQLLSRAKKATDGGVTTKTVAKQRRGAEDTSRGDAAEPATS